MNEDHDELIHLSLDPLDEDSGSAPMDLQALSPEARLATALVMQAQALEGMRRTHDDLLRRVGEGGERRPSRDVIRRVQSRLEDLRRSQKKATAQVRRLRRRMTWMVLAALVVGAGVASVTTWWLGPRGAAGAAVAGVDVLSSPEVQAAIEASAQEHLLPLRRELAGLQEQLSAKESELGSALASAAQLESERDVAQARLIELDAAVAQLGTEVRVKESELLAAVGEIEAARNERNEHIGAAARMRSQLADKDQQLETMESSLIDARERVLALAPPPVPVSTDSGIETLAEQVNVALTRSGVAGYSAIEVGEVREGSLRDLMLVHEGGEGEERTVLNGQVAAVVFDRGAATLRLSNDDLIVADVPLPTADTVAWADLGLTVPEPMGPMLAVRKALDVLLAGHELTVVRLGNVVDGRLQDVEFTGGGRTIRAERGHVTSQGPTLVLEAGAIVRNGEERPFFNGVMRLPLTPTAYAGWSTTLSNLFGDSW